MAPTDQDGKSKTASGVAPNAYPEQHEVEEERVLPIDPDRIRARAHQLWVERGERDGSANQDWNDAEEELRRAPRSDLRKAREESGSVQR